MSQGGSMAGLVGGSMAGSMSRAGLTLLDWRAGTFANASGDRYVLAAGDKVLHGPFAGGVAAIASIGGKNYYQSEAAATNQTSALSAWTIRGTTVRTASQPGPGQSGNTAYKLENINTGNNDCFKATSGGTNDASVAISISIKRIDTTGVLAVLNANTSSQGNWSVDLSLLSNGWERITSDHPAVTVVAAFVNSSGGVCGLHFRGVSGGALDFYVWEPQQEDNKAFPSSPIAPGVTRASDSMQFAAGAVPAAFKSGKWTIDITTMHKDADLGSGDIHYIFFFDANNYLAIIEDGGGNVQVVWKTTSGTVVKTVTYSRDQTSSITVDFATGDLITTAFTTGNGTTNGTVSDWPGATVLFVGSSSTPDNHIFGLISEAVAV